MTPRRRGIGFRAILSGTGHRVPDAVLTNAELERRVATTDAWIVERTGIKERRLAAPGEKASDLALVAAQRALDAAGLAPEYLDMILVATVTPDRPMPAVGPTLQAALGARCPAFDFSAACAGFVYGLSLARAQIESGQAQHVLLVGVEVLSRRIDFTDRETCVLFGDGAGAVVLSAVPAETGRGLLHTRLGADGRFADLLRIDADEGVIRMEGREIFRHAVNRLTEVIEAALAETGWSAADVNLVVPHQANLRILEAVAKRIDVPRERIYANLERYGNTSAASIPIALDEARREGRLADGDKVLFAALGAGLVWGAATLVW
jgi:3-oxoacyl-[acyl-carrier-protein] synthase-3